MFFLTVGDVGRQLGVNPRVITHLLYEGHLDSSICPLAGGRRLIPPDYIHRIEAVLRERGKLPSKQPGKAQMTTTTTEPTLQHQADLFCAGIETEMTRNGQDRERAIRVVARAKPQLHAAYLAHSNPDYGKLRVGKPSK